MTKNKFAQFFWDTVYLWLARFTVLDIFVYCILGGLIRRFENVIA